MHTLQLSYSDNGASIILYFQVISEVFLATSLLLGLAHLLNRPRSKIAHFFFISLVLILFVLDGIEFILVRLMGLSIPDVLKIVFTDSFENFLELLWAANISGLVWSISLGSVVSFCALGVYFYYWRLRGTRKRDRGFLPSSFFLALCCSLLITLSLSCLHVPERIKCSIALPLKGLFSNGRDTSSRFCLNMKKPLAEDSFESKMDEISPIDKRPDLFIFVIESLRQDYITLEIAPFLSQFARENIAPKVGVSSGNGTQLSWFSIFNSCFPLHFASSIFTMQKKGAYGLRALKKLGYPIHLLTSSRLEFYRMGERIFGDEYELCDSVFLSYLESSKEVYDSDQRIFDQLLKQVAQNSSGHCYVIFLESTHFDYSYPTSSAVFQPDLETVNHLAIAFSKKELPKLQNRYKNAIHYIDGLFEKMKNDFEAINRWDSSMIVITGDHGEEFYEEGHLFHASNLNREQTRVPIFFKLGGENRQYASTVSHIDIFPTLLDALLEGQCKDMTFWDGESIFQLNKWPYCMTARYNGNATPLEFMIQDGDEKMLLKRKGKSIHQSIIFEITDAKISHSLPPVFYCQNFACPIFFESVSHTIESK